MTKAKSKVLEEEEEDTTWSMKVASRGSGTASLTRLLVVMLMTLMMLMMFYLVYLHVRLNKLEQCQCIAETTRNSIVTGAMGQVDDDVDDYNDMIGKVRISAVKLYRRHDGSRFIAISKINWPRMRCIRLISKQALQMCISRPQHRVPSRFRCVFVQCRRLSVRLCM